MNSSTVHFGIESELNLQRMKSYKFDKPIKVSIEIDDEDYVTEPIQKYAQTSYTNTNTLEEPKNVPVQESENTYFTNNFLIEVNNVSLENVLEAVYTKSNISCQVNTDDHLLPENNVILESNVLNVQNVVPSQKTTEILTTNTGNPPVYQNQSSLNIFSYNSTNSHNSDHTESKNGLINEFNALNKLQLIKLLDRLSEKLIILYQYGFNASFTFKFNKRLYQEASKLYFSMKEKIFFSSYSTIAAIILPQEHNENFMQKFIKRTIVIANGMKWYFITEEVIQRRIKELIECTKNLNDEVRSNINKVPLVKWSIVSEPNTNINVTTQDAMSLDNNVDNRLSTNQTRKRKRRERKVSSSAQKIQKRPEDQSELEKLLTGNNAAPNRRITIGSIFEAEDQVTSHFFSINKNSSEERKSSIGKNQNASITCRELRLSRDSGIESPACNNEPSTETVTLLNEGEHSNSDRNCNQPANRTLQTGPCIICHTITHKKCLGCSIHYYCSDKCQKINWPFHKTACKAAKQRRLQSIS